MPGTPPTTPRHAIPRIASTDTDDVPRDLNAAVDRIDVTAPIFQSGLAAARPSTGAGIADRYYYATDTGELSRDAGGASPTWTILNPRSVATVTSLPGSPYDGQIIDYLADATLGIVWRFRYRAASASASKWEAIGGMPLIVTVDAAETRGNTVYGDLSGGATGPAVTAPLAGDYFVEHGAEIISGSANTAWMSYAIGATGASDNDWIANGTSAAASVDGSVSRKKRQNGLAAATALTAKYRTVTATVATYQRRWISLLPFRVG